MRNSRAAAANPSPPATTSRQSRTSCSEMANTSAPTTSAAVTRNANWMNCRRASASMANRPISSSMPIAADGPAPIEQCDQHHHEDRRGADRRPDREQTAPSRVLGRQGQPAVTEVIVHRRRRRRMGDSALGQETFVSKRDTPRHQRVQLRLLDSGDGLAARHRGALASLDPLDLLVETGDLLVEFSESRGEVHRCRACIRGHFAQAGPADGVAP